MEKESSDKKRNERDRKMNKKKKSPKNRWKTLGIVVRVLIVLGIMGFFFVGGVAAGYFASLVKDEPLRDYDLIYNSVFDFNKTGEAYFKDNELIGHLRTAEISQPITLEDVSPHLEDAILATEDHVFYEHNGVNFKATTRAVIQEFTQSGEGTGGSTITQQVVKNQLLDPSRSHERKFKEMLLAMRMERMFDKKKILEAYMNIIYLGYNSNGSNIEGVKAAAEGIFGVDVKDLNIAQSAYIAGLIQSPGSYTPFKRNGDIADSNIERGVKRMKFVLYRMKETGEINVQEYKDALTYDIKANLAKPKPGIIEKYPFLTFEIEKRAIDILVEQSLEQQGIEQESLSSSELEEYKEHARRDLARGGYKIHTTIDKELYEAFHEIVKNDELFGPRGKSKDNLMTTVDPETGEEKKIGYNEQVAATLLDNQTGAIIAMVEGRDFNELQYNLNTEPRQPGSSIKPILDYAPAIELGYLQPASVLDDTPIFKWDVSTKKYWVPKNYYSGYRGLTTVREALNLSYNLPAIKAFLKVQEEAGKEVPFDYLQKMGITTIEPADITAPSVSIGGMTKGLTVEENTNAFATFANNGIFVKSYLIQSIETFDGEVVYQHEQKPVSVFSEQTSFLMNDLLRSVVDRGTATKVRRGMGSKLDIAGKTGTTNNKYDYWFVGYTPQVSLGVWTGYPKQEQLKGDYTGRNQNIWVQLLQKTKEIRPEIVNEEQTFKKPENIIRRTVCSKSGELPSELCSQAGYLVTDYFNRKYLPTTIDDSLMAARMVLIDDIPYLAHDSTPDDFVTKKVFVKRDPLVIPDQLLHQKSKYLPKDWDETAPQEQDPRVENGKIPEAPQGLTLESKENAIQLSWQATPEDDIVGYRLYRASYDGHYRRLASVVTQKNLVYTDSTINKGIGYAYHVTAVDISGQESAPSQVIFSNQLQPDEFFSPEQGLPKVPQGLEGTRTLFGIELTWNPNLKEEQIQFYNIYYSEDPSQGFKKLDSTPIPSFSHTFIEVTDGYWYNITAVNEAGESKASTQIHVKLEKEKKEKKETDEDQTDN